MHPLPETYRPIEDYAIIGDCRSAALVSSHGSIDFLCWPRFDSPALFAGLLDSERGGSFSIAPREAFTTHRSYVGDTAVLRTTFETAEGSFVLTDCMPIASPDDRRRALLPERELVRHLRCTRGGGEVELRFEPRTGFAQANDRLVDRGRLGIRVDTAHGLLTLRTDVALTLSKDASGASARRFLREGDEFHVCLTWTDDAAAVLPPLGEWTRDTIARTVAHWDEWSGRSAYEGPYRAAVLRSAIIVRLLTYAPSGATIAAATTSLPETRGGSNNWDYRFCWLRDAAFTVRGMLALGHPEEAEAFTNWLLHATRLTQPKLMVLYDVFGRPTGKEATVRGLRGYQGASPVQTGNGADGQVQLDSYGEVIDAVWRVARAGQRLSRDTSHVLEAFGRYVCEHWRDADAGIWEPRGEPERHTHSLALCWTALDRLIDLQDRGQMRPALRELFDRNRAEMRVDLDRHAYNEALGSYVSVLDGDELDATALLFGWCGFEDPSSPRMRSTFRALMAKLSPEPGLLFRNDTAGDHGAFGICCFWIAEHLARGGGTLPEARAAFEATLSHANDVGLLAEQIEPVTGFSLGNTPQTFTHVGLINAAISIADREKAEAATATPPPTPDTRLEEVTR